MTTSPKSAWDRGVTLSEAVEVYSSDELWRQIEPLNERYLLVMPADLPPEPIKREPQPLLEVSPTEDYPKFLELLEKLKAEIISLLRNGELLGVGFLRPKHRGVEPRWISANHWNEGCRPSWDNSELWADGKVFTDVRVVRPQVPTTISEGSDTQAIHLAPSPGLNRSERPSRSPEIKAAYEELKSDGGIDFSNSLRANLPVIQSRVHSRAGSDPTSTKDLEYNAVRKAIGAKFQTDKAEKASSKSPS